MLAQAYAGIWERARAFDPAHGSALAWMIAIARQLAIEAVRSRPRDLGSLGDAVIDNLEGRIDARTAASPAGNSRSRRAAPCCSPIATG